LEIGAALACGVRLKLGIHRLEHFVGPERAPADIGIDIFWFGEAKLPQHALHRLVGELEPVVGEHLAQNLAPQRHMLIALGVAQITADFGARAPRDDEALP
jgi:hypothetical protein